MTDGLTDLTDKKIVLTVFQRVKAPVVKTLDRANQRINHNPADKY